MACTQGLCTNSCGGATGALRPCWGCSEAARLSSDAGLRPGPGPARSCREVWSRGRRRGLRTRGPRPGARAGVRAAPVQPGGPALARRGHPRCRAAGSAQQRVGPLAASGRARARRVGPCLGRAGAHRPVPARQARAGAAAPLCGGRQTPLHGARRSDHHDSVPVCLPGAVGASSCVPREPPSYGSVKAVQVHHTVSLNDYTAAEAPQIVLAICRYHRNSNGWNDIGYNALVDKYGTIYEGRAGGLDQAVIGAHAQGFNSQTAGIANIGDYTSVGASSEALSATATYIRWKLGVHGEPLSGPVTLTSAGGSASRYPAG